MSEVTTQDMFNTMVRHLIKQRVRSTQADGYSCAYRGVDGTMCAVGVLIADEHYHADLETNIASSSCVFAIDTGLGNVYKVVGSEDYVTQVYQYVSFKEFSGLCLIVF